MLETNPHEFFMKSSLIMYRSLRVKLKKKKTSSRKIRECILKEKKSIESHPRVKDGFTKRTEQ